MLAPADPHTHEESYKPKVLDPSVHSGMKPDDSTNLAWHLEDEI